MNRRDFLAAPLLVAGRDRLGPERAGIGRGSQAAHATRPALMKVGTQHGDTDQILRAMAGFGDQRRNASACPHDADQYHSATASRHDSDHRSSRRER